MAGRLMALPLLALRRFTGGTESLLTYLRNLLCKNLIRRFLRVSTKGAQMQRLTLSAVAASVLLTGCLSMGGEYSTPPVPVVPVDQYDTSGLGENIQVLGPVSFQADMWPGDGREFVLYNLAYEAQRRYRADAVILDRFGPWGKGGLQAHGRAIRQVSAQ
jgi:hypothetical protein